MVSPARLCVICKGGRNLCGLQRCPLLSRINLAPKIEKEMKKDFFGPSLNLFVGRFGYPKVSIGPLAALEEKPLLDSPNSWFGHDYSEIIELRSLLIRSKQREDIFSKSKFIEQNQELVLARKPTDIEMLFKKKPIYQVSFSDIVQPMGPTGTLEKFRLTENPKISQKTEKIARDEIKANEASFLFYKRGQDVYKITTILSSGILGLEENKKLVPTRWSITATDDIIFKKIIQEVKQFPSVNDFFVYESQYLDNHFLILLMPGNWEFENFEAWAPGSFWSQQAKNVQIVEEYESFRGRTVYAELEGGGYYASRIGIAEGLKQLGRQGRVVVFREVYEGYMIPLGVWVVRETVRNAFKKNPLKFSIKEEALKYIDSKLRLPVSEYMKRSRILKQKRLGDFF